MKWWMGAQTVLLVVALMGLGLQQRRLARLEDEVVTLQARAGRAPTVLEVRGQDGSAEVRERLRALRAANTVPADEPVAARIDDHLWSEEGRAVIDDVVQAREAQEQERRGNRFRAMAELRRDRMIERARTDFGLDDDQTEQLRATFQAYGEERREVWRAMRGEGEVDTTALMERSERAQETMREQLETLLGEEDAGRMLEQMRGPF